ncbi:VOC family protein [Nocardioides dongxiaopingii]|uniref:bleomycin resistance protein n=1 Tax=Nocardioides sp. S-1144 TaxID=2582905 RepID=UPI00110D31AF|nr:VOC family protein [Nocardioides sp. S-1144]QCW50406.1 VOC family protein [Nocardioides sp. S-1144]
MRLTTTVPALPVRDVVRAVEAYERTLGFHAAHLDPGGFAIVVRDDAELHLWQAADDGWRQRTPGELAESPVRSGAEDFLAGTASCRIACSDVDALHAELAPTGALHPTDAGRPAATSHGTREVAVLDLDGNLLTFVEAVVGGP